MGVVLQVTAGETTQAEAARKWQVDVSTIIGIRRVAKDAALAAFARRPGRPTNGTGLAAGSGHAEIGQLTEAIRAQAIELAVERGNPVLAGGLRRSQTLAPTPLSPSEASN